MASIQPAGGQAAGSWLCAEAADRMAPTENWKVEEGLKGDGHAGQQQAKERELAGD